METIAQLAIKSQVSCNHLNCFLTGLNNPQSTSSSTELNVSRKGIKNLCQNLSSGFKQACNVIIEVPQPVLDEFQKAIHQFLQQFAISKEMQQLNLKPQKILMEEVKEKIENYIQLPANDRMQANYANCDLTGIVTDNKVKINVCINFFTTQKVQCEKLEVESVMALAMDNSVVNINDINTKDFMSGKTDAIITRL